jgi:hypothetical protein
MVKKISPLLSILPAAITDPEELDPMAIRGVRRRLGHPLIQGLVYRQFQIDDRTASFTEKVVMRPDIGIEAIKGAAEIDLLDQPLVHQDVEVSVHRTHTEVGELPLQPFVDPVRRGMPPGTLQQLENSLSLPTPLVFAAFFDSCTPY